MARQETFAEIQEAVLDEARLSTNASRGTSHRNYVKRLIRRYYTQLYVGWDWEFSTINREDAGKDANAGQRYYDFPTDIDTNRENALWYKLGAAWIKLDYGIGVDQYSAFDSDNDERSDPPLRWMIRDDGQFEIWPMPASTLVNGLRFEGYKKKTELVADSSRCDLDTDLIALFVAAEILAGNKAADAPAKLAAAQAHFMALKGNAPTKRRIMGGAPDNKPNYRVIGGRFAKV